MEWVLYRGCDSGGSFAKAGRGVTFGSEYDIRRKGDGRAIYYKMTIRGKRYWSTILIAY
jgi:hypothetical protein